MNLVKILKNVPAGTKLYSVVEGEVEFKYITHDFKIIVLDHNSCEQEYHLSGRLFGCGLDGEVVLFPSKDNRDWDTFCPFKKGDVIVSEDGFIAIFDHMANRSMPDTIVYQALRRWDGSIKVKLDTGIGYVHEARLATQEEKDLFFKAFSEAGYSWNGEEVVSVFKKGDIILSAGRGCIAIVDHVGEFGSHNDVVYYQCCLDCHGKFNFGVDVGIGHVCDCTYACIHDQERILRKLNECGYVLNEDTVIKKRFDPKSFEPFQKVLVRDDEDQIWKCDFFSHFQDDHYPVRCTGDMYSECIPFEGNGYLVGTSQDCDKLYKWWENN
jgi:hypothetical protein